MSYDLTLYLAKPVNPDPPDFGPCAVCNVDGPLRIEAEDISEFHGDVMGRRRQIWQITLEGTPSPDDLAAFDAWLSKILAGHNAVLVDEQAGTYRTRKTQGPLPNVAAEAPAKTGALSFFFEDSDAFHPDGLGPFMEALKRYLPQALPARYGGYEPLQGRVSDGDLTGLVAEWEQDPELIMRAKTPFGWIFFSLPCRTALANWHPDHRLRTSNVVGRIEFEIRPKLFADPSLVDATVTFMARAAELTGAFYAELRREECPVVAWFWRGLPPGPVEACLVGPPYIDLWPESRAAGEDLGGDRVLLRQRIGGPRVPEPPAQLRMPEDSRSPSQSGKFAEIYPFPIGAKRE